MAAVLLEAGIVFAALAVGGAVAARVDQSVIPAYIVAGLLLGPASPIAPLRLVETTEFIELLRELGVVLLLFFIGLEFNLSRLAAARTKVLRAGGIDMGLNGLVGLGLGLAFGFSVFESVLLAGVVAISSSAVITKSLIDLGWIADPESEAILGVLVAEDIVVAVYLAVVAAVAVGGTPASIGRSLAVSLAVVAALVLLAARGTALLERLFETDSDELFLLRTVGLAALVGGLALSAGVSEAVAAFFLGAAVGTTSHVGRIERLIVSERDLYAAVFFFAVGLETDLGALGAVALPLVVLVVLSAASKLVSGYVGGRAYGLDERRSTRVALALVARGEFSLVIAAIALSVGATELVALTVGYVLVMSVLGTTLMRYSGRIERTVVARLTPSSPA
ncbi:cation:proton antiporter [Halosegnis marinus]|uniref:Cation:proton antiporter n=1 Tax=Halosegnis marinus TaxID=3034023 RepID=A0ABD5ZNM9_9EURY|nr:cation:proton antiporter [Halosegnis sp. DT85]